ncbi:hypothetical protein BMS3Bbin01_02454 [bacterium BMS3Bbin01]|nr:hypothetical protein BMS3Bbin01_02454 [bacterium BMS3Bbin01]
MWSPLELVVELAENHTVAPPNEGPQPNFHHITGRLPDGHYGATGWYAAAPCAAGATYGGSGTHTWCKPRLVKYNRSYPEAFDTATERRWLACHELGHTLGLFHNPDTQYSCLAENPLNPPWTELDAHNEIHLQVEY